MGEERRCVGGGDMCGWGSSNQLIDLIPDTEHLVVTISGIDILPLGSPSLTWCPFGGSLMGCCLPFCKNLKSFDETLIPLHKWKSKTLPQSRQWTWSTVPVNCSTNITMPLRPTTRSQCVPTNMKATNCFRGHVTLLKFHQQGHCQFLKVADGQRETVKTHMMWKCQFQLCYDGLLS